VVVLAVLLLSIASCIPHLGVSCANHNSSRTGAITRNSNRDNCSSNGSTVVLPHRCSRLPSGHHISFLLATSPATTVGRWGTLLENAANPSKVTHRELRHSWSISREAIKRVMHHKLAAPTTPPWWRSPREKKC
jgi:hypothetical protein